MHFNTLTGIACLTFLLVATACEHDRTMDTQQGLEPTFSSIQNNILTPKCVNAGCHPGGGAPMSLVSGIAYDNLVNVTSTTYGLERVEPGGPDESVLYLKVIGDSRTGPRMPLDGPVLSSEETDAIRDWIEDGAPDN